MKKRKKTEVKVGRVAIPIYRHKKKFKDKGKKHYITWRIPTQRVRKDGSAYPGWQEFADYGEARREAKRIAERKETGHVDAAAMTNKEAHLLLSVQERLRP